MGNSSLRPMTSANAIDSDVADGQFPGLRLCVENSFANFWRCMKKRTLVFRSWKTMQNRKEEKVWCSFYVMYFSKLNGFGFDSCLGLPMSCIELLVAIHETFTPKKSKYFWSGTSLDFSWVGELIRTIIHPIEVPDDGLVDQWLWFRDGHRQRGPNPFKIETYSRLNIYYFFI